MSERRVDVSSAPFPAYVVWELTLRCDQPCTHCGSRAGESRPNELSTDEALGVVRELMALSAREVVLIGGEAYLHPGFLQILAALRAAGIRPTMTTGGRGITAELAAQMAAAGLHSVSVSIDGLERTHDLMRAGRGSFASATAALGHLRRAGLLTAANTNVNRFNQGDLEALYEHLVVQGICAWQVQLTAPLGRAADRPDLILQPYDLLALVPRIAALKERAFRDGVSLMPGNNLGYFGPEEALLRSPHRGGRDHFAGCQAGRFVLGLESDGGVKGCPSLQSAPYVGGNVRERPLRELWHTSPRIAFARARTVEDLWGFCRTCRFAEVCLGGCTFTAHALLGRPGNNPYCHYRARELARAGQRERLVFRAPPPGTPFDSGLFELITEPLQPGGSPNPDDLDELPAQHAADGARPDVPLARLKVRRGPRPGAGSATR
ncbi:MAG: radical SAM protein [Polyangia bacterium]